MRAYGFQYRFNGRNYATDILAKSEEDAVARIRAMAGASLIAAFVVVSSEESGERPVSCD
jgi:hypothetical protein